MRYLLLLAALVVGAMVIVPQALFTVSETEYGVVTRFGQIQTIYSAPGLKSKTPFVDQVQKFDIESQILENFCYVFVMSLRPAAELGT